MAITRQGLSTYLVSQNKLIWLLHWQPENINNVRIVKAFKLVDGINFDMENKEYNLAEVLFDLNNSDNSNKFNPNNDKTLLLTNTNVPSPGIAVI